MSKIRELVNEQANDFGIEIVDVRIRRADLPEANSQAIYRRMQTERSKKLPNSEPKVRKYQEAFARRQIKMSQF